MAGSQGQPVRRHQEEAAITPLLPEGDLMDLKSESQKDDQTYYEMMANRKSLNRVCMSEYGPPEPFHNLWAFMTCLMLRFNFPRPDYLYDFHYLRKHSVYYFTLVCIYVPCQFVIPSYFFGRVSPNLIYGMMILSWMAFVLYWTILAKRRAFRKLFKSRANMLQTWETVLWLMWNVQGIVVAAISAYRDLRQVDMDSEFLGSGGVLWRPHKEIHGAAILVGLGVVLTIFGTLCKMYCMYLSGLNNYYYYDMILNTPNERFVDSGLYKITKNPTYTLGWLDAYGYAMLLGGLGGPWDLQLLHTMVSHLIVLTGNHFVEEPFVEEMYMKRNPRVTEV